MSELENSKTNKIDGSSNICKNKFTSNKFNPIKEDKDGVQARRVIWSTESLNIALK